MTTRLVKHWKAVTISIPDDLLRQLETLRGDVPRSQQI